MQNIRKPERTPAVQEAATKIIEQHDEFIASVLVCSECKRPIDPSGESLTEDQHWICQTCALKVTVMPSAVIVPLAKPVYHKITVSLEEHQWHWLQQHPREKASWILREAIEAKI